MELIKTLWRGELPLYKAFWLFGFGVNSLFVLAIAYLDQMTDLSQTGFGAAFLLLLIAVYMIYAPFILIAIWRSADKYDGLRRLAIAAKIAVLFGWANYLRSIGEMAEEFL